MSDQMASYHNPLRKSIRWFHKVAIEFLFGTAVVNAWLLYNAHCRAVGQNSRQLQIAGFREFLADSLLNAGQQKDSAMQSYDGSSTSQGTHYLQVCSMSIHINSTNVCKISLPIITTVFNIFYLVHLFFMLLLSMKFLLSCVKPLRLKILISCSSYK